MHSTSIIYSVTCNRSMMCQRYIYESKKTEEVRNFTSLPDIPSMCCNIDIRNPLFPVGMCSHHEGFEMHLTHWPNDFLGGQKILNFGQPNFPSGLFVPRALTLKLSHPFSSLKVQCPSNNVFHKKDSQI